MITKTGALGTHIDWDKVRKATEKPITYYCKDKDGHEFFKMYKPSEAAELLARRGWTGKPTTSFTRFGG